MGHSSGQPTSHDEATTGYTRGLRKGNAGSENMANIKKLECEELLVCVCVGVYLFVCV